MLLCKGDDVSFVLCALENFCASLTQHTGQIVSLENFCIQSQRAELSEAFSLNASKVWLGIS